MIRNLYRLWPHPGLLMKLGHLTVILAILQGCLLGLLVPILRALIQPVPDFGAAAPWLAVGAVGVLLYGFLTIVATPVGFSASMQLAGELRHHLMRHVTTLPLGWFTPERKARLARAVTADVTNLSHLAVVIGSPAITATLVPATITLIVFFIDWRMALLFIAIGPLAYLALRRAGRIAGIADAELEEAATEVTGRAIELGQAQAVLRAAGQANAGSRRMQAALEDHRVIYRRGLRRSMEPDLTYTGIVMLGFVAVLLLTVTLLLDGTLTTPDAIVLMILAVRFLEPLASLIELIGALRAMDNAIGRVQSILDTPALTIDPHAVPALPDATIRLDNVGFAYADKQVLSGVSFCCAPGSMTALVGHSGSGKTTLIRLIARFFDVDEGRVLVGGRDVRKLDPKALMDEVAIVFQDVYLFDISIEENLRLAKPDATAAELAGAASAARLDEVIERLPQGWQTRVGEGGAQLSGGERQRVSIARAFLKQSRIVLIDEASSALDPENERAIGEAIANLASDPQRTVIVIAHRTATLAAADQVIVLDRGRIVECGEPDELIRSGGRFADLRAQYERAQGWHIAGAAS